MKPQDDLPVQRESTELTGHVEQPVQIDWREAFKSAMRDFIGVRTPEDALRVSLEQAKFSLKPDRDDLEFRRLFRINIDELVISTLEEYAEQLQAQNQEDDGQAGERDEQAPPQLIAGETVEPSNETALTALPQQEESTNEMIARMLNLPAQHEPQARRKRELDPVTYGIFSSIIGKVMEEGYKNEQAKIDAYNEKFLQVVREYSRDGEFIVIHGTNTVFANSMFEILQHTDLRVQHSQLNIPDNPNFYRIPLNRWVAFCETNFPDIMQRQRTGDAAKQITKIE